METNGITIVVPLREDIQQEELEGAIRTFTDLLRSLGGEQWLSPILDESNAPAIAVGFADREAGLTFASAMGIMQPNNEVSVTPSS